MGSLIKQNRIFSYVYISDLMKVMEHFIKKDGEYKSYNVTDGQCYDRYALANLTKAILKKQTLKFHIPESVVNLMAATQELAGNISGAVPTLNRNKLAELTARNWSCSIESIRHDLGYVPHYDLRNGLTETLQWYKDNKWIKS